jgi:uncharacterized protein
MIELIKEHRREIEELCKKFNVKSFEVFGSAAVTETFDDAQSDLDFLIEFMPLEPTQHAKHYFNLLEALQDIFQRQIDLVEFKAIENPYLLETINKSRESIYAA